VREKFESALVGARVRTTVVMLAPSRITYSKLRAVTPQTQLRELYEFATASTIDDV
jgi:hypothetical protein